PWRRVGMERGKRRNTPWPARAVAAGLQLRRDGQPSRQPSITLMTSIRMPPGHAHVAGMATALPAVTATVDEVWDALGRARGRRMPKLQGEEGTRTRYFAQPLASLMERRTQSQQTDAYLDHARILARRVCCRSEERSGIAPSDIGLVIGVSCTGEIGRASCREGG